MMSRFYFIALVSFGMNHNVFCAAPEMKGDEERLLYAASMGLVGTIGTLLDHGTSINCADGDGCTPLHRAAINGREVALALLFKRGADVSIVNNAGRTAAEEACRVEKGAIYRKAETSIKPDARWYCSLL